MRYGARALLGGVFGCACARYDKAIWMSVDWKESEIRVQMNRRRGKEMGKRWKKRQGQIVHVWTVSGQGAMVLQIYSVMFHRQIEARCVREGSGSGLMP
ncbi:uncharacterized protein K452DRAFT_288925 [Aplosporella prunicola CBS 121167]|uniref:Uncharacterized protein n=1 Tax=Aplosporella prunicola CBS 121167 TaxID=1176127 RepID=A0A6A6B7V1_9PEZI|nr:uncharacterized protein K452DRAFT_288925 [Aplosporella prunicola CBS 121167]KAF2140160.1 hypothetical protein K452DRAFT_288925 [Aplosporella prunicola CBS 121167]